MKPSHQHEDDDPNNYRGITINSCLPKLFILLLNDRMKKLCESKAMIHGNQISFRKGFRPADHVFTLKTISQNKKLCTCFDDFSKAYDTIWRDGLYYKLLEKDGSKSFTRMVNTYSNTLFGIKLPLGMTSTFSSKVGMK